LAAVVAALRDEPFAAVIVCCADPDATRAGLGVAAPPTAVYAGITLPGDADEAKAVAARDCDVLVEATGLAADIVSMLLAGPAREVWSIDVGVPPHREPVVSRAFA